MPAALLAGAMLEACEKNPPVSDASHHAHWPSEDIGLADSARRRLCVCSRGGNLRAAWDPPRVNCDRAGAEPIWALGRNRTPLNVAYKAARAGSEQTGSSSAAKTYHECAPPRMDGKEAGAMARVTPMTMTPRTGSRGRTIFRREWSGPQLYHRRTRLKTDLKNGSIYFEKSCGQRGKKLDIRGR